MKNKINKINKLFNLEINPMFINYKQNLYYLLAKTKNEDIIFETKDNYFIFKNGTWNNGIWNNGIWIDGHWYNGTWIDGTWYNGTWNNGTWNNGTWENGIWESGIWKNGIWSNGAWNNGTWNNGYILNKETNKYEYSELSPNKVKWSYSYQE